jgi:hypothetical protein
LVSMCLGWVRSKVQRSIGSNRHTLTPAQFSAISVLVAVKNPVNRKDRIEHKEGTTLNFERTRVLVSIGRGLVLSSCPPATPAKTRRTDPLAGLRSCARQSAASLISLLTQVKEGRIQKKERLTAAKSAAESIHDCDAILTPT